MTPRVFGVLVILVLLTVGAWRIHADGYERGQLEERTTWTKKERQQLQDHATALAKARQKEQDLQASADQLKVEKDREITRLNANVDHLVEQLRKRPTRPAIPAGATPSAAIPAGPEQGCTGDRLYSDDGQFLARYAGICAQAQAELNTCQTQYNQAREKLKAQSP